MKIPMTPPSILQLIEEWDTEVFARIVRDRPGPAPDGKYRHWDTLRHLQPPPPLTSQEWWLAIKLARQASSIDLPLRDRSGQGFRFAPVDVVQQMLMQVDRNASGRIQAAEQVTDPQTRDTYLLKGLIEEAITSSQLEGASTTREVAKDMIRQGRQPETHSEQMIYNNYQALQFIRRMGSSPLTPSMVFELQKILTDRTLENPTAAGRFREESEKICVMDEQDTILHMPPAASELPDRMAAMCEFANAQMDGARFVHPVVKAIVLHFWLAYDHPFVDGNGRTARALFYWSMASQGYWLCEFISISRILKQAPGRYARSFLYTETDDNDVTYFVLAQLRVILRAIQDLLDHLEVKQRELRQMRMMIEKSQMLRDQLNFRQLAIVRHAMKHPGFLYTIESHRNSNNISYATARSDLLKLANVGLLHQRTGPRKLMLFASPADLQQRITRLALAAPVTSPPWESAAT
ncbi:MAG TPA: Fic family protein [Longimicrobiaceae bacterium]|nr:Fic family protein [Longimicrobiaceae bacterium]